MALGVMFFVVAVAVIAIWIIIEAKRLKHKLFAIFIIALILFTYISFTVVLKNSNTDVKTVTGLVTATKLYGIWLGNIFKNMKSVTSYVSHQDWKNLNETKNASTPAENQSNLELNNSTNSETANSTQINKTDPLQSIWDKL